MKRIEEAVDVRLKNFLINIQGSDGELLVEARAKVRYSNWGDTIYEGVFFLTDRVCGFLKNSGYGLVCKTVDSVRYVGSEVDNELYLRFASKDPINLDLDSFLIVQCYQTEEIDKADYYLRLMRIENPISAVKSDLKTAFKLVRSGEFEAALQLLQRLAQIDPLAGVIDLMIARTLNALGRFKEAATRVAKKWYPMFYFAPSLFLQEYMNYEWHPGALRYLPDPSSFGNNGNNKLLELLVQALHAKAKDNILEYTSAYSKLLQTAYRDGVLDAATVFQILCYSLLEYTARENAGFVQQVFNEIYPELKETFTTLTASENETEDVRKFLELVEIIKEILNSAQYDESVYERLYKDLEFEYLLLQEDFEQLAEVKSAICSISIPSQFSFSELMDSEYENAWAEGLGIPSLKEKIYKLFAALRNGNIELQGLDKRLSEISSDPCLMFLENTDVSSSFLYCLLAAEIYLKKGDNNAAKAILQNWKKEHSCCLGTYFDPYLRFGEEILSVYEGWALDLPLLVQEALDKLPQGKPFCWLHKLGAEVMAELKGSHQLAAANHTVIEEGASQRLKEDACIAAANHFIPEDTAGAIQLLRQTADMMSCFFDSSRLDPQTKQELAQSQHDIVNAVLLLERQSRAKKGGLWGNIVGLFSRKKREVPIPVKIALGGETSSGKTTLLNSMFQTNIFFVTQEEATGVPVEVQSGDQVCVEVFAQNGVLKDKLLVKKPLLSGSDAYLNDQQLSQISEFITRYTRVGSPELESIGRVKVSLPLLELPENTVLVDTPGFNAHDARSVLAEQAIEESHVCLFIIDARNALKGQEMAVLEMVRKEVGKTFLVLNKMDLVVGDDDLDCDGEDATENTIERVRSELMKRFAAERLYLYPVCSLDKQAVAVEAQQYVDNLTTLKDDLFKFVEEKRLDLLIDSLAKQTIAVSDKVLQVAQQAISDYQHELKELERALPVDLKLFENEIRYRMAERLNLHRSNYIESMSKSLSQSIEWCAENFMAWLNRTESASVIQKEIQKVTVYYFEQMLEYINAVRAELLCKMGDSLITDLIHLFEELYYGLPFKASFNAADLTAEILDLQSVLAQELYIDVSSVQYENSLVQTIGMGTGAAIGGSIFGPIGAVVGAVAGGILGSILGGRPLEDIKKDVYDVFCQHLIKIENQIIDNLNKDLSPDNMSSYINSLNSAIKQQVEEYRKIIADEISRCKKKGDSLIAEMEQMKETALGLRENVKIICAWRDRFRMSA